MPRNILGRNLIEHSNGCLRFQNNVEFMVSLNCHDIRQVYRGIIKIFWNAANVISLLIVLELCYGCLEITHWERSEIAVILVQLINSSCTKIILI